MQKNYSKIIALLLIVLTVGLTGCNQTDPVLAMPTSDVPPAIQYSDYSNTEKQIWDEDLSGKYEILGGKGEREKPGGFIEFKKTNPVLISQHHGWVQTWEVTGLLAGQCYAGWFDYPDGINGQGMSFICLGLPPSDEQLYLRDMMWFYRDGDKLIIQNVYWSKGFIITKKVS